MPGASALAAAASAVCAVATPSSATAQTTDKPLIAHGCTGCHGQNGAGRDVVPKIAGIGRDTFLANWNAFKSAGRPATIMNRVASGYTDAEAAMLADYFSKLK